MNELTAQHWYMRLFREVIWISGVALSIFIFLALISFDVRDPGWSFYGPVTEVHNTIGPVGAFVSDWLLSWFGYAAFLIAWLPTIAVRWIANGTDDGRIWIARLLGLTLSLPGFCIVLGLHLSSSSVLLPIGITGGGILGGVLNQDLVGDFGVTGTALGGLLLSLMGITVVFSLKWSDVLASVGSITSEIGRSVLAILSGKRQPAQLNIESQRSLLGRILAPINHAILPKTVRRTLTKVAPRPPEADVAQIEAELLGLRATVDTSSSERLMPKMPLDEAILNDGPRLDFASLDTIDTKARDPSLGPDSLVDSVERTITISPSNEAQALLYDRPILGPGHTKPKTRKSSTGQMALPDLSLLDPADPPSDPWG